MWLPETALDDETLDVLAQEGMRFTIVAPGQVRSVPNDGHPGRYTTSTGRTITLCIYDGDISHGIAFGGLLKDAHVWAKRMLARGERRRTPRDSGLVGAAYWEPDPASDGGTRPLTTGEMLAIADPGEPGPRGSRHRLVSAATDGETYGHHHRFSEMALARVVLDLRATRHVTVENFASYLATHPAADDVQIVEPSAWSCAHGVERWRSDCSCRIHGGTSQAWRASLRAGIAELADGLHAVYEREARRYFDDPWAVRDAYGEVVATPEKINAWVADRVKRPQPNDGNPQSPIPSPQSLLEMERGALRLFTSCAWFFDDIGGLEPIEVLRYAARAIQLAGPDGARLEEAFLARLATAHSNEPGIGTGRDVYLRMAKPRIDQMARLAGSAAAARATAPDDDAWRSTTRAVELAASASEIVVRQRRTGDRSVFAVDVTGVPFDDGGDGATQHAASAVVAHVRPAGRDVTPAAPIELTLAEMTEGQRDVIVRGVRRRLVTAALGNGSALPRDGEVSRTLSNALLDALARLANGAGDADIDRITALLDLFELEQLHIPFDAQTRFHDAIPAIAAVTDPRLAVIAVRLGFAPDAFAPATASAGAEG